MNELAANKIELANGMLADIKHLEITLLNKKLEYSKYCFENGVLDLTHLKADDVINIACDTFNLTRKQPNQATSRMDFYL
jgi:hypothetical protein